MPSYQKRRGKGGSASIVAQVRVRPFKPVSKSFPTKAGAKHWAEKLEAELVRQRDHGQDDSLLTSRTVATLITEYLNDPDTQGLRSFKDRSDRLAWWVNLHGGDKVIELGVRQLRAARARLQPGRAPATVNRYLASMRACWNWGRACGLVPRDMVWPTKLHLREPSGRVRYLSDDELAAVLTAIENEPEVIRAAVIVALATGIRRGELMRLVWGDVDLERQRLRVLVAKNRDPRAVFLPSVAVQALRRLAGNSEPQPDAPVLTRDGAPLTHNAFEHSWRRIRTAAGLEDFRWHDLRHSCASYLAQHGATLLEIGSVLGHRSPSITQRYAHLVQGAAVTGHDGLDKKLSGGNESSQAKA